jgi:hypothetical protein
MFLYYAACLQPNHDRYTDWPALEFCLHNFLDFHWEKNTHICYVYTHTHKDTYHLQGAVEILGVLQYMNLLFRSSAVCVTWPSNREAGPIKVGKLPVSINLKPIIPPPFFLLVFTAIILYSHVFCGFKKFKLICCTHHKQIERVKESSPRRRKMKSHWKWRKERNRLWGK